MTKDINGKEIIVGDWIKWDWFLDTSLTLVGQVTVLVDDTRMYVDERPGAPHRVHTVLDNARLVNIDEVLEYKLER